jgi:hypothetical protein
LQEHPHHKETNMKRALLTTLAVITTISASPAVQAASQECGWFAILHCSKSNAEAIQRQETDAPGQIIKTNDFEGLRPGYYCIINGPMKRNEAKGYIKQFASHIQGAYVKRACGDFNKHFPD